MANPLRVRPPCFRAITALCSVVIVIMFAAEIASAANIAPKGRWWFQINGDHDAVRIKLNQLRNGTGRKTLPLSIHLVVYDPEESLTWANNEYHILATVDLRDYPDKFGDGTLPLVRSFWNIDETVPFRLPPDGTYEVGLAGAEYDPGTPSKDGGYHLCAFHSVSMYRKYFVVRNGRVKFVDR